MTIATAPVTAAKSNGSITVVGVPGREGSRLVSCTGRRNLPALKITVLLRYQKSVVMTSERAN